jgi:hypothetical protein
MMTGTGLAADAAELRMSRVLTNATMVSTRKNLAGRDIFFLLALSKQIDN